MKPVVTLGAALMVAVPVSALAGRLEWVNDPATEGPGKFAVEEIRREAMACGVALGNDAAGTRTVLTVTKEGHAHRLGVCRGSRTTPVMGRP